MKPNKLNVRLLRRIQNQILKEPRQFFMSWWFTNDPDDVSAKAIPNCGTAACIGGWAVTLSQRVKPARMYRKSSYSTYRTGVLAAELIRLPDGYNRNKLFVTTMWPPEFHMRWRNAATPLARAKVAVARIEHLIKHGD